MVIFFLLVTPNCQRIFLFPDYDKEKTAGVKGQQTMLTPPWHPILPVFLRGPCLLWSCFVFVFWTFDFDYCLLSPHVIEICNQFFFNLKQVYYLHIQGSIHSNILRLLSNAYNDTSSFFGVMDRQKNMDQYTWL